MILEGYGDTVEPLFERPPWREANPVERPLDTKSKHKCIDFYPWQEATSLKRPLFFCKVGGLRWRVNLLYLQTISSFSLLFFSRSPCWFELYALRPIDMKLFQFENVIKIDYSQTSVEKPSLLHSKWGLSKSMASCQGGNQCTFRFTWTSGHHRAAGLSSGWPF